MKEGDRNGEWGRENGGERWGWGENFGEIGENFGGEMRFFGGVWVNLLILKRGLKGCSFE